MQMSETIKKYEPNNARPSEVLRYAHENGFQIHDEPFGHRGRSVEIWKDGRFLAQRKSWGAALNFMRRTEKPHD